MLPAQAFRLLGTADIENIPCDLVDGHNIIYWDDINLVFPGLNHLRNGNLVVNMMRGPDRNSHAQSSAVSGPSQPDAGAIPHSSIQNTLQTTLPLPNSSSTTGVEAGIEAYLSMLKQDSIVLAEIDQRLIARLPPASLCSSRRLLSIYAAKDGKVNQLDQLRDLFCACHEELRLEMKKNAEMQEQLRLQDPAYTKTTLQNQVQTVLDRALLLKETAIPRLFIVLPQDTTQWDSLNLFANRFRLLFLCECGEYTKSPNSRILHYTHLASHKGYDLARPEEFFKEYGCHVLAIHRMIKLGIPVAGLSVPTLSLMVDANMADQHNTSLDELVSTIDRGMDQVIGLIEKVVVGSDGIGEVAQGTENNDALDTKDLCKLNTFLKKRDADKVPGNLYKTITTEGHVRWVCHDHYNDRQHLKAVQALRNIVATLPRGSFDENIGRLDVALSTRDMADQLYSELVRTQSVYDLKVEFKWDTTYSDLKDMFEALCVMKLEALELGFGVRGKEDSDVVSHGHRYDPILDIMRHPSIRTFALTCTPADFFTRSSLSIRDYSFDNLRYMEIELISVDAVPLGLMNLVTKTPNLLSLTLTMDHHGIPAAYSAMREHQKCPIVFKDQWLRILPPPSGTFQPNTTIQDTTDMFRIHGGQIEAWD
ncbi:hypothetical protein BGX31_000338, partial [Mortierella sp. GBA43]